MKLLIFLSSFLCFTGISLLVVFSGSNFKMYYIDHGVNLLIIGIVGFICCGLIQLGKNLK